MNDNVDPEPTFSFDADPDSTLDPTIKLCQDNKWKIILKCTVHNKTPARLFEPVGSALGSRLADMPRRIQQNDANPTGSGSTTGESQPWGRTTYNYRKSNNIKVLLFSSVMRTPGQSCTSPATLEHNINNLHHSFYANFISYLTCISSWLAATNFFLQVPHWNASFPPPPPPPCASRLCALAAPSVPKERWQSGQGKVVGGPTSSGPPLPLACTVRSWARRSRWLRKRLAHSAQTKGRSPLCEVRWYLRQTAT